jgi:hypothetical protein
MLDLPGVKTRLKPRAESFNPFGIVRQVPVVQMRKQARSVRYGDRLRATRYLIRGRGVLVPGGNDRIRRAYSLDLNDRRWDSVIGGLG